MEEDFVPNPQNIDLPQEPVQGDLELESPYLEPVSTKAENQESIATAKKPEKKKPKYLPFLIIIPVLLLLLALGAAYWQINRMAKENEEDVITEEETPENEENGNEEETPEETVENVELDLSEISDSLREIDDAIYDIDATFELIDESLAKNDDTPQL